MILYKLNNNNQISWWKIEQDVDAHNNPKASYTISWGHDVKTKNNSSSNNNWYQVTTTEKAAAEIASHLEFQINRKGYSETIPTSVPDLPMLAQTWSDHIDKKGREPFKTAFLQPKLDGIRCIATHDRLISRKSELITSCPHISYILEHLSPEHKLDGELYIHGVDLQTMQSYVLRQRPHRVYKEIEYHVFDYVDTEMPYRDRYELLRKIIKELMIVHNDLLATFESVPEKLRSKTVLSPNCPIKLVTSTFINCSTHDPKFYQTLKTYHKDAVSVGYEGTIVRNPESTYGLNYRSPDLLKFKDRMDDEFEIIDVVEAYNQMGTFVCKTKEGNIFEATPSWTTDRKRWLLRNKEKYIGKMLTVEFEKYSKDKVPLKATGKATRKKKECDDPVKVRVTEGEKE